MSRDVRAAARSSSPSKRATTVVVLDDDPAFRTMLRSLSTVSGLEVIDECSDLRSALSVLRAVKPTFAIVNVDLPVLNGIEIIRIIREEIPQIRFIAATINPHDDLFDGALKHGTSAFVLKTDLINEFQAVISAVLGGRRYISPWAQERLLDRHAETIQPRREEPRLTAQQRRVVEFVAQGFSNKEIAEELGVSEGTVEKHRSAAMQRLGLQTFASLVRYAVTTGLVEPKTRTII